MDIVFYGILLFHFDTLLKLYKVHSPEDKDVRNNISKGLSIIRCQLFSFFFLFLSFFFVNVVIKYDSVSKMFLMKKTLMLLFFFLIPGLSQINMHLLQSDTSLTWCIKRLAVTAMAIIRVPSLQNYEIKTFKLKWKKKSINNHTFTVCNESSK